MGGGAEVCRGGFDTSRTRGAIAARSAPPCARSNENLRWGSCVGRGRSMGVRFRAWGRTERSSGRGTDRSGHASAYRRERGLAFDDLEGLGEACAEAVALGGGDGDGRGVAVADAAGLGVLVDV